MAIDYSREAVIAELDRLQEDSLHSEKAHFEASRIYGQIHFIVGIIAAIAAALASAAVISEWYPSLAAGSSALAACMAAALTFINPAKKASQHLTAGNAYSRLRGKMRRFVNLDCNSSVMNSNRRRTVERFADRKDRLNAEAPAIPRWAYLLGKCRIGASEAAHEVDAKMRTS